jgi:hypothetical protein
LLDWYGTAQVPAPAQASADAVATAEVILDLHGAEHPKVSRTWRVVDAFGCPVLRPLAVTTPPDRSLVSSLYLIESTTDSAGWCSLAQVHLSTRRGDHALLDAVGRAVAWLVAAAVRAQRWPTKPPALRFEPLSPFPANRMARRMHRAKAILCDHFASDVWAITRVAEPVENFFQSRTVSATAWLEIPAVEGFVADPFPWPGRPGAILYERFSNETGRGTIEALLPDANGKREVAPLRLNIPSHLSYPSTYADADLVLCLPEMLWERRQVIYRLEPDGAAPVVHAFVAEGVAMADPTLFRRNGLYWIAYNDADLGLHENLCLLYAERLEGPWLPHPHNPVKMDVRSSRPGGTPFVVDGALFRPAQDCSHSYGCALVINKVVTCTPDRYQEEPVARLTPDPAGGYPDGLHTLSITSDGILFDGKRIVFNQAIMRQRLQRQLRTTWRRFWGNARARRT